VGCPVSPARHQASSGKGGPKTAPNSRVGGPEKKAVTLGYRPSVIQLDIDPNDHAALAERCRAEWAKMEVWLANERPAPVFDGTLASLIDLYLGHEDSPYQDLRHRTQRNYDQQLKVLKTSVGARRIDRLNGEDFRRWYRKLTGA